MKTTSDILHEIYTEEYVNTQPGSYFPQYPERWVDKAMEQYAEQFKQKWINVMERLPENTNLCLVFNINGVAIASYFKEDKSWIETRNFKSVEYIGITHWMPLPEPPKTN